MCLKINEIRMLESYITPTFLADNQDQIKKLLDIFKQNMNRYITEEEGKELVGKFYLKGGNAFSQLKIITGLDTKVKLSGDYDFQLLPKSNADMKKLDEQIIALLKKTVSQFLQNAKCFNEKIFDDIADKNANIKEDKLKDILRPIHNKIGKRCSSNSNTVQGNSASIKIGDEHLQKNTVEILSDENYRDKRLCIRKSEIKIEKADAMHPITIYANYTIPEFILYRIVYRRPYEGDKEITVLNTKTRKPEQTFTPLYLKSEIIDISVPRKGSSELILSNEIAPYLHSDPDFSCMIPGWGYHFYENLNLLQENELGISGSPWKKEKRLKRGKEALRGIDIQNKQQNPQYSLYDLYFGGAGKTTKDIADKSIIKSVCDMYTYQLSMLTEVSAGLREALKKCITEEIIAGFGKFRKKNTDSNYEEAMQILSKLGKEIVSLQCANKSLENALNDIGQAIKIDLLPFRYILDDSYGNARSMPVNFVIAKCQKYTKSKIDNVEKVKNALTKEVCGNFFYGDEKKFFKDKDYFLARLRLSNSYIYYAIDFVDDISSCKKIKPEELLKNSMFVVQRVPLIEKIRKK